jgi:hypothetical protein
VPQQISTDALQILLFNRMSFSEIASLPILPGFIKTALIFIIRTITKKEREEFKSNNNLIVKPNSSSNLEDKDGIFAPNFIGVKGFNHLRSYKEYIHYNIQEESYKYKKIKSVLPFSEIEHEILDTLPDIPTYSTRPLPGTTEFRNWV